jgi:hypothetical protein
VEYVAVYSSHLYTLVIFDPEMEVVISFKTLGNLEIARLYTVDDVNVHKYLCEKLRYYNLVCSI